MLEKEQHSFEYDRLVATRVVNLHGVVTAEMANQIVMEFDFLLTKSKTLPIVLDIDSVGGNVSITENGTAGYKILKTIENCPVPVYCKIHCAISMAYVIASACDKGHRYVVDYYGDAMNMHHDLSSGIGQSKFKDIKDGVKRIEQTHNVLVSILSKNTGRTKDEIENLWYNVGDCYQSAQEMIDFGAADKIYTKDTNLLADATSSANIDDLL